jgi:rare lipoprotein A
MKAGLLVMLMTVVSAWAGAAPKTEVGHRGAAPKTGLASWYGEEHRGKLMANRERFDPGRLTAASWHYPLGTQLRVTGENPACSVVVTVTDRGPARRLVREGRIIDLAQAAFERLASSELGLVAVTIQPVR